MDDKLQLNSKAILEKQFEKDVKGYNPDQVDEFLDIIIKDYKTFATYFNECKEYISSLEMSVNKLNKRVKELEIKNSQLDTKVQAINSGTNVNSDNIQYVERINQLEKALFSRGVDPKSVH